MNKLTFAEAVAKTGSTYRYRPENQVHKHARQLYEETRLMHHKVQSDVVCSISLPAVREVFDIVIQGLAELNKHVEDPTLEPAEIAAIFLPYEVELLLFLATVEQRLSLETSTVAEYMRSKLESIRRVLEENYRDAPEEVQTIVRPL